MRGGHNPNREQKKLLSENKKDWTEWLLVSTNVNKTETIFTFKHKTDNTVIQIDNDGNMLSTSE